MKIKGHVGQSEYLCSEILCQSRNYLSDLNQMKNEEGELNIHDVLNSKNTFFLSLSDICATEFLEVSWFWTHLWS